MKIEVLPFAPERRADFYAVHSDAHGCGWCNCVAWWTPTWEGWADRSAADNRALRESLLAQDQYDGYLLYVDDAPAGWCQTGPRDRLTKLAAAHDLARNPAAWAVSCLLIAPAWRGRGLARALLTGVIDDLRGRGVQRVEAFPRRGDALPAEEVWTGPERLFLALGFLPERVGERRTVMALRL